MTELVAVLEKKLKKLLVSQDEILKNLNSIPGIKVMIAIK